MNELITKYLLIVIAVFQPLTPILLSIIIFIVFDLITGLYARIIKKKETFESHKLRKTIEKFVYYSVAIIVAQLFDMYFMNIFLTKAVSSFIAITELFSVYENITLITGTNIVKKFICHLKNYFKDFSFKNYNKKDRNSKKII